MSYRKHTLPDVQNTSTSALEIVSEMRLTGNKKVTTYRKGKLTFTVTSNVAGPRAIADYVRSFNNLFEEYEAGTLEMTNSRD